MGGGSAKTGVAFPTLLDAYMEDPNDPEAFVFAFTSLRVEWKDPSGKLYKGHFWVTGDALKYRITKKRPALYAEWTKAGVVADLYDPRGEMLCRLPCTALQNQAIADVITAHPDPVKFKAVTGLINHEAPIREDMTAEGSLLLTPRLCDLRYEAATMKVGVHNQSTDLPQIGESAKLHRKLNAEIQAKHTASGKGLALPNIVADAGKIWAIHEYLYADRESKHTTKDGKVVVTPYKAAVNYGWHGTNQPLEPVSQPNSKVHMKVAQSVGTRHNALHWDYSQMGYLVAGWCEVLEPDAKAWRFERTEKVYRTKPLCNLVVHDGKPLARTKY